jgi:VanZ family protein
MVLMVLYFGLRVKGRENTNDVHWVPEKEALRFEGAGIAYVDDLRTVRLKKQAEPLTIEMVVTPGRDQRQGFSPLLILHDGADQRQLAIWQYADSLIVMNGDDYDYTRRWPRITGKHIFQADQTCYLAITADEMDGTRLYVDGDLVAEKKDWCLRIPLKSHPLRLVLGNSVYGYHGWTGDFHGLGITFDALSATRVKQNYERWAVDRTFSFAEQSFPKRLYTFDRQSWIRMSDNTGDGQDLEIPKHVIALKIAVLSPPKLYFRLNRAAVADMVLNTVGFMPLGAVLFAYLGSCNGFGNRRKWIAVSLCALLSLGIELAQAWIPTRFSTLLDLILNTAGAWIGIEIMYFLQKVRKHDLA